MMTLPLNRVKRQELARLLQEAAIEGRLDQDVLETQSPWASAFWCFVIAVVIWRGFLSGPPPQLQPQRQQPTSSVRQNTIRTALTPDQTEQQLVKRVNKPSITTTSKPREQKKQSKRIKLPEPDRFLPRVEKLSPHQKKEEPKNVILCKPVSSPPTELPVLCNTSENTSIVHQLPLVLLPMRLRLLWPAMCDSRFDLTGKSIDQDNEALVHQDGLTRFFHVPYLPNANHTEFKLKRIAREFMPIIKKRKYNILTVSEVCCCSDGIKAARGEARNTKRVKTQTTGGSEDQCLGYNRTHRIRPGNTTVHSIFVRLRNKADHYKFHTYKQVVTTMCHELAHCVHRYHSPLFYKLMKEIQDEHENLVASGQVMATDASTEEQFGFDIYGASISRARF